MRPFRIPVEMARWARPVPLGLRRIRVITRVTASPGPVEPTLHSVRRQDYPAHLIEHVVISPPTEMPQAAAFVQRFVEAFTDRNVRTVLEKEAALEPAPNALEIELALGETFPHDRVLDDLNRANPVDLDAPVDDQPLVSVIMPAYNEERFIEEAIASVLEQTYPVLEVLVIDDGSTDDTRSIVERVASADSRVKLIEQPHAGLVSALNRGLERAKGTFIARMDANDRVPPERIARQVAYLMTFEDVAVVGGWMSSTDEEGNPLGKTWQTPTLPGHVAWSLHFATSIVHASILARRQTLSASGGYRSEGVTYLEDYDLWARLLPVAKMASLPQVVYLRRELKDGVTFSRQREQADGSVQIVRRLVGALLEREITIEDAQALFRLHRGLPDPDADIERTAELVKEMHWRFPFAYELSLDEREAIAYDVAKKLSVLSQRSLAARPDVAARLMSQAMLKSPRLLPVRAGQSVVRLGLRPFMPKRGSS